MQRSFSSPALVLRVRPSGESNREAVFLSAVEGIISATLFGGPKSRLRSHVSPFNSGQLWTYRDPAREFRKVSDFDVQFWRPGLRELYERSNTASLIAGTVLSGRGGGGAAGNGAAGNGAVTSGSYGECFTYGEIFTLVNAALDALETADESCCERIFIHFMWNWTGLLGSRGDVRHCVSCTCETAGEEALWFIPEEGFFCKNCIVKENPAARGGAVLGAGARRWLLAVQEKPPAELVRYTLDTASLKDLKALIRVL